MRGASPRRLRCLLFLVLARGPETAAAYGCAAAGRDRPNGPSSGLAAAFRASPAGGRLSGRSVFAASPASPASASAEASPRDAEKEDALQLEQATRQLLARLLDSGLGDRPSRAPRADGAAPATGKRGATAAAAAAVQEVERHLHGWSRAAGTDRGARLAQELLFAAEERQPSAATARSYALVMDAWAKAGRVDQVEAVFERLAVRGRDRPQTAPPLDRACCHSLLHANSAAGRADRCLDVLSLMEDSEGANCQPLTADYNLALAAHARRGDAPAAERLLKRMVDRCVRRDERQQQRGVDPCGTAAGAAPLRRSCNHPEAATTAARPTCDCAPDLVSYNLVLDAHAKSHKVGAGDRATSILRAMQASYNDGDLDFRPDARTYSAVMKALVKSGGTIPPNPHAHPPVLASFRNPERMPLDGGGPSGTALLPQLQGLLQEAKQTGVELDSYVYTILLDALANSRVPDAAERAEELLDEMEREGLANDVAYNTVLKVYKNNSHRRPDAPRRAEAVLRRMEERKCVGTISYTTMAGMYANRGDHESAERAGELLRRTLRQDCANVQTFNSVLHAWVRCGRVERAEAILAQMEAFCKEGREELSPNVVSYSTIMSGWAKSRDEDALPKTKATFDRMKAMYETGNQAAAPNAFSYATLVSAYSRSRDNPEAAAQAAQDLLMELYEKYQLEKNPDLKPNAQILSTVIDAWQKSGCRDAGDKAESLLNWALGASEQDGDLCPNEYTFASTIAAWGKSRTMGKAVHAHRVLQRMIELYESGKIKARPNTHCFTAVINSCAYSENDSIDKSQAVRIAIDAFKDLVASRYGDPNEVTYSSLLTALRNLLPPGPERSSAMQVVFKKAAHAGLVDELVLRRVQSALTTEELQHLSVPVDRSSGRVDKGSLPEEWRRNLMARN